jgi:hypothetical protein
MPTFKKRLILLLPIIVTFFLLFPGQWDFNFLIEIVVSFQLKIISIMKVLSMLIHGIRQAYVAFYNLFVHRKV